jgi:alkanesulfonate monooxygenase SsuD/methylene tetrahydromethanopterin reductase-like flavin-dependent oxidoreductase (luciferase family)
MGAWSTDGFSSDANACTLASSERSIMTLQEAIEPASDWLVHPWVAEGARRVRFGVMAGPLNDWPRLSAFVARAEELGFDSYWAIDHPLRGADWATNLAALAVTTRSLRLGTLVACVYYRNPVLLARQAADVDRLSGGRFVLGLGIGHVEREFARMGISFPAAKGPLKNNFPR